MVGFFMCWSNDEILEDSRGGGGSFEKNVVLEGSYKKEEEGFPLVGIIENISLKATSTFHHHFMKNGFHDLNTVRVRRMIKKSIR